MDGMSAMGGMGGGMGYGQAIGILGTLGTDIWGMIEGDDMFGRKPEVAPFKKVDFGAEQKKAIGSNIAAMPDISRLGDLYKSYMTDQMEDLLPGWSNILATGAKTTQATLDAASPLLRGEIPKDIQDMVRRSSAYGAMSGGYAGSGMARNLTGRDFGLTSLNLMQQGANLANAGGNAAQRWGSIASGETLDPKSFYITPQQQAAMTFQNNLLRQQFLQNKYNVAAAPDPQVVGTYGILSSRFGAMAGMGGGSSSSTGGSGMDISQLMNMFNSSGGAGGVSSYMGAG